MSESQVISAPYAALKAISKPAVAIARGHISVFYPALIILDIYVCGWALLIALGNGDLPIIRVLTIVIFVVVPLLFAYALIRFMTVSVIVAHNKILIRRGWPFGGVITIAREDLSEARAEFSYLGKKIGAGALSISTREGKRYRVKDIDRPDTMADRLNAVAKAVDDAADDRRFSGRA